MYMCIISLYLFMWETPPLLQEIPLAGPKDAAFRHYSGPVGKPTYEMKLRQGQVPRLCWTQSKYMAKLPVKRWNSERSEWFIQGSEFVWGLVLGLFNSQLPVKTKNTPGPCDWCRCFDEKSWREKMGYILWWPVRWCKMHFQLPHLWKATVVIIGWKIESDPAHPIPTGTKLPGLCCADPGKRMLAWSKINRLGGSEHPLDFFGIFLDLYTSRIYRTWL